MRNCDKCFENTWSYEFIEGIVRATCNFCTHVVEFESRKKHYNIDKKGSWGRWEFKEGKSFLYNEKYPNGIEIYLDESVDWEKQHPLRIKKCNLFKSY